MGKKMIYATEDKLAKVNVENKELIRKFFSGKNMNLTESTKVGYASDFNQWLVFLMENYQNKYILDIDVEDQADMLEDFINFCTQELGNNERRIQRRISSISSLFIYLKKKRRCKENPCELIERPKLGLNDKKIYKKTYLTEEQIETIRNHLKQNKLYQLECYVNVALSTMARVNAIQSIRIEQIDLENKRINEVLEKEQKIVTLFLSSIAVDSIKQWLDYREKNGIQSDYLFINTTQKDMGKQISKSTIQSHWVKQIGAIVNEPTLHSHDFRYSGSTILRRHGASLEVVSKLLNHEGTDLAQKVYIQKDDDSLQAQKELFDL